MPEAPAISIVMPVFNGAKHLRHALDSISAQTPHPGKLEIIVAEDGSTDDSPRILRDASATLPITLIDGARQGNWVASTNRALEKATGDFVSFLHQDDAYMPTRLKTLLDSVAAFPDAHVFAHPVRFIDGKGKSCGSWSLPSKRLRRRAIDWFSQPTTIAHNKMPVERRLPPSDWFPQLLVQNNLAVPGVLFRRSLLDSVGYLDDTLRYTADWDFWLRLASRHDLVQLPERLSEFRIHRESQTVGFAEKQTEYADNLRLVLNRHADTLDSLPGIDRREADAFRAMATLGVEANRWLASRLTPKPQPAATLIRALRAAGAGNAFRYIRLSRVVPRTLARFRANVKPPAQSGGTPS
ncbi:MAG: glycosyltransferase family 2 protein [Kiritimatiellia bacterium]|jgi:glycosyltransferase involved in cell wall biosynthesis